MVPQLGIRRVIFRVFFRAAGFKREQPREREAEASPHRDLAGRD